MNNTNAHAQKWFDRLEVALAHEAEHAGLLEQSTLTGSAREFLVKRVLKSILPPSIHIGTGKIVDAKGNSSKQVDIVLFDSRFPVFEIDCGVGLYPLEGVISVIEVKSTLTTKELYTALDNAYSLISLTSGLERALFWNQHIKQLIKTGLSEVEAKQKAYFEFVPATYIFAFNSKLRKQGLANAVKKWFDMREQPTVSEGLCAVLPRVIVSGLSIGLLHDGLFKIDPGADILQEWQKKNGTAPKHIMSFWDTGRRFGWLATHLIHTVCSRIGLTHERVGVVYGIDHYLSIEDYFEKDMKGQKAFHDLW